MKTKIESPFTDGFAYLKSEIKTRQFRKEDFLICEFYYVCEDTKEEFTTTEVGDYNLNQIYNQYRAKYGFPFSHQIREMREKYGLHATQMSKILGLGVNMIRNYEIGEMPSTSNAMLLNFVSDPIQFRQQFLKRYEACGINEKKKKQVLENIEMLIEQEKHVDTCLPKVDGPNQFTGYKEPDFEKLSNMLIYFLSKNDQLLKMTLNYCLFYADFYNFKNSGKSISGTLYHTINNNPAPVKHLHLFASMVDRGFLEITSCPSKEFDQEIEKLKPAKPFNRSIFSEDEIGWLDLALNVIVKEKRKEKPWGNIDLSKSQISYQKYAFLLE